MNREKLNKFYTFKKELKENMYVVPKVSHIKEEERKKDVQITLF